MNTGHCYKEEGGWPFLAIIAMSCEIVRPDADRQGYFPGSINCVTSGYRSLKGGTLARPPRNDLLSEENVRGLPVRYGIGRQILWPRVQEPAARMAPHLICRYRLQEGEQARVCM